MLFTKMCRDIKDNLVSFIAIFAMSFIAMYIFLGSTVVDEVYLKQYISERNFRDLEVSGELFSNSDIEDIKKINGVTDVEGYYNTKGKILRNDKEIKIQVSYINGNDISKLYIAEGEPYTKGMPGIWIDKTMASAQGIKTGDICELEIGDETVHQEVKGLVYSPQYLFYIVDSTFTEPEYDKFGYVIMDESQRTDGNHYYNTLLVDTGYGTNDIHLTKGMREYLYGIRKSIRKYLENDAVVVANIEQDTSLKSYLSDIRSALATQLVFGSIFTGVAILGIISTISRLILKHRIVIGTMKALGFSDKKIYFHYLSYSFFPVLLGMILGAFVSYHTMADSAIQAVLSYYLNPYEKKYLSPGILIQAAILLLTTAIVTYTCIKNISSESVASILRPLSPAKIRQSWYEKLYIWKYVRFSTKWNLRDISTHPLRTIMSILGVMTSSALIFSAFCYMEGISYQPDWSYTVLTKAKCRIEFSEGTDYGTVYDYARQYNAQMVEKIPVTLQLENDVSGYFLTVADKGSQFLLNDTKGKYIKIPDRGIVVSDRTLKVLGIKYGSFLYFNIPGDEKTFGGCIKTVNKMPLSQGIVMSREYYESLGGEFLPNTLFTSKTVPEYIEDRPEIISVTPVEELRQGVKDALASNYSVIVLMSVMAVSLGIVLMINLGAMSYSEKVRDMAVLKVLGFGSGDLKRIIKQQNFYITLTGYILGIPVGFQILKILLMSSGELKDYMIFPTAMPYMVDLFAIVVLSEVVNIYMAHKIDKVDMVEELKEI